MNAQGSVEIVLDYVWSAPATHLQSGRTPKKRWNLSQRARKGRELIDRVLDVALRKQNVRGNVRHVKGAREKGLVVSTQNPVNRTGYSELR